MRRLLWLGTFAISRAVACNYTVGECYPVGQGPGSAGVGANVGSSGGTGASGDGPPKQPQGLMPNSECNASDQSSSGAVEASMTVFCKQPEWGPPCAARCAARSLGCVFGAVHPYKPAAGTGLLFSCNDLVLGQMCGYHYPNATPPARSQNCLWLP